MKKEKDLTYKINRISELMGGKVVFRVGVDKKNGRIDLLSVDACVLPNSKEVIAELPENDADYIG